MFLSYYNNWRQKFISPIQEGLLNTTELISFEVSNLVWFRNNEAHVNIKGF